MARYRVFIERTENYSHQVVVSAKSAEEAERKVRRMDDEGEAEVWENHRPPYNRR